MIPPPGELTMSNTTEQSSPTSPTVSDPIRKPNRTRDLPEAVRREVLEKLRPAREEADDESFGLFVSLQDTLDGQPVD
jgi:hypothetical protein